MAYASTNPPVQWTQAFGGLVKEWAYRSSDSGPTVAGSSYFSNGHALGMRAGDSIYVLQVSTGSTFMAQARGAVTAVTTGAGASITFITTSS